MYELGIIYEATIKISERNAQFSKGLAPPIVHLSTGRLVVMGGDLGCEFESQCWILDGSFSTLLC